MAGSRFVYLKGPLVRLEFALVQWVLALLEGKGFTPVVPPVLVREQALFGTGMLPDTEQQIYTRARTTSSTWPAPRRCRSPRCTRARSSGRASCRAATPGSPPASGARRARRARTRRASSGCTSSTRSRCSASSSRTSRPTSTSGCWRSRRRSWARSRSRTAWSTSRRRPGRLGRQEVRPRGVAAGPGPLPRAHLVLEHDRLPGAPPGRPLPARGGRVAAARAHAQRHRGGGRPDDHRDRGEPPARRRHGGGARGAARVRRAGDDSPASDLESTRSPSASGRRSRWTA